MKNATKLGALIATALLAVGLAGCGTGAPKAETTGKYQQVDNGYGAADLVPLIVELDNNRTVECVALIGYSKGGVTCNWDAVEAR